jgi:hypothetical protein
MKHFTVSTLCMITILLLSACGSSVTTQPTNVVAPATSTPMPITVTASPTPPEGNAVGGITDTIVRIVQEQGSGALCNDNPTYFVYVDISSNAPTSAQYRIDATDASGQVPDGIFDGYAAPEVTGTLTFQTTETQSIQLRLTGPYSYPDTITIRAYVNGKDWPSTTVVCQ